MKIEQFLSKLKEVAPKYSWAITPKGIRGTLKGDDSDYCFCPITAVYYSDKVEYAEEAYAYWVGKKYFLLDESTTRTIIASADMLIKDPEQTENCLNGRLSMFMNAEVNEELMKAVGLADAA